MKQLYIFILMALCIGLQAQVEKIRVAKEEAACDYELVADPSLAVLKIRLRRMLLTVLQKRKWTRSGVRSIF